MSERYVPTADWTPRTEADADALADAINGNRPFPNQLVHETGADAVNYVVGDLDEIFGY